jgi:hypothetical protein
MTVVSLGMAYRSFLEVLAGSHPPRYAASLKPSSPRFTHSSSLNSGCLRRRHRQAQAGHVHYPGLEALRVLRAGRAAGAALRAQYHRHADLPAEHVAYLGGLVGELVHRHAEEVTYISSATGLSPVIAAPTATPTIAGSEIGVSIIRSGPSSGSCRGWWCIEARQTEPCGSARFICQNVARSSGARAERKLSRQAARSFRSSPFMSAAQRSARSSRVISRARCTASQTWSLS